MSENINEPNEISNEKNMESLNIQSIDSKCANEEFDQNEMDYSRHLPHPEKSNKLQGSINLFKSFIGIGILSIPYCFSRSGYVVTIIILLFVGYISNYCCLLIIKIADEKNTNDVFRLGLGHKGVILYRIFIIILQVGICISYIIFFTEYFRNAFSQTDLPDNKIIYAIFSLIIVFPLSIISNFHLLYKFSIAGSVLCIITLLTITEYSTEQMFTNSKYPDAFNFDGIGYTIGMMILAFEAIGTILTVRESLEDTDIFPKMFSNTLALTIAMYCIFGFVNVWGLENIHPIVFIGLEQKRTYFYLFQVFYALAIIFSYPVQLFPALFYLDKIGYLKDLYSKSVYYWYGLRLLVSFILFFIALGVPSFATFVNFIGSLCGTTLQFVFPVIAYYNVFSNEMPKIEKAKLFGIFIFGISISIFGIYSSIKEFGN